jgi:hypothetical protein
VGRENMVNVCVDTNAHIYECPDTKTTQAGFDVSLHDKQLCLHTGTNFTHNHKSYSADSAVCSSGQTHTPSRERTTASGAKESSAKDSDAQESCAKAATGTATPWRAGRCGSAKSPHLMFMVGVLLIFVWSLFLLFFLAYYSFRCPHTSGAMALPLNHSL